MFVLLSPLCASLLTGVSEQGAFSSHLVPPFWFGLSGLPGPGSLTLQSPLAGREQPPGLLVSHRGLSVEPLCAGRVGALSALPVERLSHGGTVPALTVARLFCCALFSGPGPVAGGLVLRVPRRAHALALQMLFVPAFHRRQHWRPRGGGAGAGRPRAHK